MTAAVDKALYYMEGKWMPSLSLMRQKGSTQGHACLMYSNVL